MNVNFVSIEYDITNCIKKWNKEAYNYGVGYKDEFEVVLITPDEVHINSKGLLQDGIKSPNLVIRNKNDVNFPFSFILRDEYNNLEELAIDSISGKFKNFKQGMKNIGYWIISDVL